MKQPKYRIGDIIIVKDYVNSYEYYAQMKIADARFLVRNGYWEYRSIIDNKTISGWYIEDSIIEKLTDNDKIFKNGFIGKIDGFTVDSPVDNSNTDWQKDIK